MSGHEVIADALNAWTDWLGAGRVTLGRAISPHAALMFIAAGLLSGIALLLTIGLLIRCLSKLNRVYPCGRPLFLPRLISVVLIGLFLVVYFVKLHRFLQYALPSAAR